MKLDERYVPEPAAFLQAIAETDGRLALSARPPAALTLRDPRLQERDMLGEGLKVMKRLTKRLQELEDMKKSPQEA
jgi:hypothetical protein